MDFSPESRKSKHLKLSQTKLERAKEILGATTEAETVELALEAVIAEAERNEAAWNATKNFLNSRIEVRDVFGNLD